MGTVTSTSTSSDLLIRSCVSHDRCLRNPCWASVRIWCWWKCFEHHTAVGDMFQHFAGDGSEGNWAVVCQLVFVSFLQIYNSNKHFFFYETCAVGLLLMMCKSPILCKFCKGHNANEQPHHNLGRQSITVH